MKGVMLEVPEHILRERRISGADQWDEVWEGVLHMVPPPNVEHQDLEWHIETWLRRFWVSSVRKNKVYHQVALSPDQDWVHNYRTPDIVLFTSTHLKFLRPTYCHGPCTVAVEVRSPNDETHEKFDFYAQLAVPEIWVIDRDSKKPEIHILDSGKYREQTTDSDGWLLSQAVNVMLAQVENSLLMQITNEPTSRTLLPE